MTEGLVNSNIKWLELRGAEIYNINQNKSKE